MEKSNHIITQIYFRGTNFKENFMEQMLKKKNRIEYLRLLKKASTTKNQSKKEKKNYKIKNNKKIKINDKAFIMIFLSLVPALR
jgi:hypothetical protein